MCSSLPATVNSRAHGLRVRGFLDRLHEIFDDNVNVNVIESVEQYELTYDGVLQQVRQNPRLRGIYMANESVRGCMDALERAKPNRRIHVVCHDLTPHALPVFGGRTAGFHC